MQKLIAVSSGNKIAYYSTKTESLLSSEIKKCPDGSLYFMDGKDICFLPPVFQSLSKLN